MITNNKVNFRSMMAEVDAYAEELRNATAGRFEWKDAMEVQFKLVEEVRELLTALERWRGEISLTEIFNEGADVLIMLCRFAHCVDVDFDAVFLRRIECNLDRARRAMKAAELKDTEVRVEWRSTSRRVSEARPWGNE